MSRCCVIYNPVAGHGQSQKVLSRFLDFLSRKYSSREVSLFTTEGKNHAVKLAEKAYHSGHRDFVCVGGDGTFNEMCQTLVGEKNVRAALVPSGTGNDLAVGLGFARSFHPVEWEDFFRDKAESIDVGRCNDRFFFNTMGIGFDALVASEVRHWEWLPRKWRYYPPIFRNLLFYRGASLSINSAQQRVFLLAIGNGRSSGGGVPLTPSALINDGLLDLCWIENIGLIKRVKNLLLALKGKHVFLPFAHTEKFEKLHLSSEEAYLTHMDGEIFSLKEWHVSVHPSSLFAYVHKPQATLLQ